MKYYRPKISNYQKKIVVAQQANFAAQQANFMPIDPSMLSEQLQNLYQMYGPQALDMIQQGMTGVQNLGGQVATHVGDAVQQVSPYLNNAREAVGGVAGQVAGGVQDIAGQAGNLVNQYGRPLAQQGVEAVQQAGNAIGAMSPAAKNAALGAGVMGVGGIGATIAALRGRGQQAAPVAEAAQAASRPGFRQRAMSGVSALAANPMARKVGLGLGGAAALGGLGLAGKAAYDSMNQGQYSAHVHHMANFCSDPTK